MYNTIDLFAGAGGLSYGFLMNGNYRMVAAAEINEDARKTYRKNIVKDNDNFEFIENVVGYDFTSLNDKIHGGIDVVIGGPPCQGFSNANRQKSNLISMNNGLVKEYFRAIKEIQPKAFVMENVSMLSSDTHRFYESTRDNIEISALVEAGYNIKKREDCLVLSKESYEGLDLKELPEMELSKLLIPQPLAHHLSVLSKNVVNKKRLPGYIIKYTNEIIKQIEVFEKTAESESDISNQILNRLIQIKEALDKCKQSTTLPGCNNINTLSVKEQLELGERYISELGQETQSALNYIVGLQKLVECISEIKANGLIGEYTYTETDGLMFKVNSYAVIDYVNAILGDQYVQTGGTVNAEWFGVPQERRRYIIIGLRKDIAKDNNELSIPSCPQKYKTVTVGEAINDLASYVATSEKDSAPLNYCNDENLSAYAKQMRENSSEIYNHIMTNTSKVSLDRFKKIKNGKNFHSLSLEDKETYSKPERTQNTIYLRLDPNKPSGTVVNVRKSMWIHPTLDRAISIREAARLQSFPDRFVFEGTKDSQYQQVGNAVPPLLAKEIANTLTKYI